MTAEPAAESLDKDGVTAVLLAWDADTYRIAIKAGTNKDPRSFNVQFARDKKTKKVTSAAFSGVLFLKHIQYDMSETKRYPLTWVSEHAHFEAQLPAEMFQAKQPLVAVEGGKKHGKAVG